VEGGDHQENPNSPINARLDHSTTLTSLKGVQLGL